MEILNEACSKVADRHAEANRLVREAIAAASKGDLTKRNLVWIEGTGCSGNIISLLNGFYPDFQYLITHMTNFIYNNSLEASDGEAAMERLFSMVGKDYILAVEGAVATKDNGRYTIIGRYQGREITALEAVKTLGEAAATVIAVGACASHGGVSAARPNPSASVGISDVLSRPIIKLPGCPCNPDWFMGTLAYLLLYGDPKLDDMGRPEMFYSTLIHDRCPRRSYFDQGIFAEKLGEKTCMFRMGCRGPITPIDCPVRQWNGSVNWPIRDDTPCIGCAQFGFPDRMEPFVTYPTAEKEVKG